MVLHNEADGGIFKLKNKIMLTIFLAAVFVIIVALFSLGSGATGMAIVQPSNNVEFPGIALFFIIIICIGGYVLVRSRHN
jgi:hypothetical protein